MHSLHDTEPTHGPEIETISRCLAAARLRLLGKTITPPLEHWRLTEQLLDEAERALRSLHGCRRRIVFDR